MKNTRQYFLLQAFCLLVISLSRPVAALPSSGLRPVTVGEDLDLFVWTDTCNVYGLRDGDAALLIDLGDGSVLDHLDEIGVRQVEWILFTHHHREQCQGFSKLRSFRAKLAAPEVERALFERPADFRKSKPALGDAFTVYGASYVRPPIQPIALSRTFKDGGIFTWRGREFRCLDTSGNSPGCMSYLLKIGDYWLAFSGDVMLNGAKMHTWFDTEWDYGYGKGLYALINSVSLLENFEPLYLLPSHGPMIREPKSQLPEYQRKLRKLAKLYVRGYDLNTFAPADQDTVSRPTSIPHIWQVSEHLYKFKRKDFWPNFSIIIANSGHALVVDCGLIGKQFLEQSLQLMQQRLGLKKIDAVLITHMHGDHFLEGPYLQNKWGAQLWTLEDVADKCEQPERYDYAAMIPAYKAGFNAVRFDRVLSRGESFNWEGHTFTVDWLPGQTEFACCIHGRIDGKLVAFTGDNIFGNPADPRQTGHEAVVAHNSAILEEGYIYAADYLDRLQPDLIVGGHSWVINQPEEMIRRFGRWAREIRDVYQTLSAEEDYRYMFDPYWIRAEPYRVPAGPSQSVEIMLHVRNFLKRAQKHRIAVQAPEGIIAEPPVLQGQVKPESTSRFPLRLKVSPEVEQSVNIVGFDITLDGRCYGQWFDLILFVDR